MCTLMSQTEIQCSQYKSCNAMEGCGTGDVGCQNGCQDHPYVPGFGCETRPNICQVVCTIEGECEFTKGCASAGVSMDLQFSSMNATKCAELCLLSNDSADKNPCRYWRYVR